MLPVMLEVKSSLPVIPEVTLLLLVVPQVALTEQLCLGIAISWFSRYIWNELNAAMGCCEPEADDFRRGEEPNRSF